MLVYIILNKLVRDHRLPKAIILDRDKFFLLKFWKSLTGRLGIKLRILTAYYLEKDGQIERRNELNNRIIS